MPKPRDFYPFTVDIEVQGTDYVNAAERLLKLCFETGDGGSLALLFDLGVRLRNPRGLQKPKRKTHDSRKRNRPTGDS